MTDHRSPHLEIISSLEDLARFRPGIVASTPDDDLFDDFSLDRDGVLELVLRALARPGPDLTVGQIADEALARGLITGDRRTPVRARALDEIQELILGHEGCRIVRRHAPPSEPDRRPAAA